MRKALINNIDLTGGAGPGKLLICEPEAKSAKKEMEQFVFSIIHNLRSPLNSILGATDMILNDGLDKKEIEFLVKEISDSVMRMDTTIKELLDYSKASRSENAREIVDINEIVTSSFEDTKFMNKNKVNFIFQNRQQYPFQSDSKKVTSIIQNLVSNAVKYADDQKTDPFVKVDVNVGKANCRIIISDNGIGIPSHKQANVFDMFYRATNRSTGTGLGLFLLKEIVNKLRGSVALESIEGIGTCVILDIPNMHHYAVRTNVPKKYM